MAKLSEYRLVWLRLMTLKAPSGWAIFELKYLNFNFIKLARKGKKNPFQ